MIILPEFIGRFGNKVITYNNLRQIADLLRCEWSCPSWEGSKILENCQNINFNRNLEFIKPSLDFFLSNDDDKIIFELSKKNIILDPTYLGSLTSRFVRLNPKNFLTRNIEKKNNLIAIHFRGTDFHSWNPKSILTSDYYINSIEYCRSINENYEFSIMTDDFNLRSLKETIDYLNYNNFKWKWGNSIHTEDFFDDYLELISSKIIISSPSTFSISAGMLGNCLNIHSKDWIHSRIAENDKFWIELNKLTDFYKIQEIL